MIWRVASRLKKAEKWAKKGPYKTIFPTHLFSSQGSFFYLFHALIALLLVYPYLEVTGEREYPWLLILTNAAVLTAIVYTVSFRRDQFLVALCIQAPMFFFYLWGGDFSQGVTLLLSTILYLYVILLIIPFLLHSKTINSEDIFAVTSFYILLGMTWSSLFHLIHLIFPGSFYVANEQNIDNILSWSDFLYFSFVTLTTLGYGDITPITSYARSLAIIEAITGILFLATVVSRAVGLYVYHSIEKKS